MVAPMISAIAAIFLLAHLGFIYALRYRRNDIADVLWGLFFVVAGWTAALSVFAQLGPADVLPLLTVTLWGVRLSWHIGLRFLSHAEDRRYANWRQEWGPTWKWRSYLQIFILQPVLAALIALPLLRALSEAPRSFSPGLVIGFIVWVIGFVLESVADAQLKSFKADPANKGRLMDRGLWSWSRHPNYFGEVVQWWGVFVMCYGPGGWWLVISPLVITFFILKVSGVTMLEELMQNRTGFADYKKQVSPFLPLPPGWYGRFRKKR